MGAPAPDFELPDQHGQPVGLSALRGTPVVVVFYPFAFTGVCTQELRHLRESTLRWGSASAAAGSDRTVGNPDKPGSDVDAVLLAVSCDTMFTLRVFAEQEGLEFAMLSDFWPHGDVAQRYGVFDAERGCAVRGSFVIDRQGVVRWSVVHGLSEARDVDDYVRVVRGLG